MRGHCHYRGRSRCSHACHQDFRSKSRYERDIANLRIEGVEDWAALTKREALERVS
jgi:hypothetical protein